MKIRKAIPLALSCLMSVGWAGGSEAQLSSTGFKLDGVTGSGATMSSTGFRTTAEVTPPASQRTTSAGFNVFPTFLGLSFSPLATLRYSTAAKTYSLVAFPLSRANSNPVSVLDELGGYDVRNWRFGRFNTTTGGYQEPGSGLTTIGPALGYWLITDVAKTNIQDTGVPQSVVPILGVSGEFPLANGPSSAPGWNQMGNPYPYPIDIANIGVTDNSTYFGAITGGGNTLTEQFVKIWNPTTSAYENATIVNGRQGFWVKKLSTAAVNMIFSRPASPTGTPAPQDALFDPWAEGAGLARGRDVRPLSARWTVSVTASQGERRSEPATVGAGPVAEGEWNALCASIAPAPPGLELLSLRIPRPDWGRLSGDYSRVVSPAADVMAWDLVLGGAESPGEVTLSVDAAGLPANARLLLTDRVTGVARALEPGGRLTLPAYSGDRAYRLEASVAGASSSVASAIETGLRQAYPNPFRTGTGLAFSLARGGDLEVQIFDLQGRLMRSLSRLGAGPGEHVLVWNGRDESGRDVGSGVFLARWRAAGVQGTGRIVRVE